MTAHHHQEDNAMPRIDRTPIPDHVFRAAAAEIVAAEQHHQDDALTTAHARDDEATAAGLAELDRLRQPTAGPYDAGDAARTQTAAAELLAYLRAEDRTVEQLRAALEQARADLAAIREVARSNKRHSATLTAIVDRIEDLTSDDGGNHLPDDRMIMAGEIREALQAPVPEIDALAQVDREARTLATVTREMVLNTQALAVARAELTSARQALADTRLRIHTHIADQLDHIAITEQLDQWPTTPAALLHALAAGLRHGDLTCLPPDGGASSVPPTHAQESAGDDQPQPDLPAGAPQHHIEYRAIWRHRTDGYQGGRDYRWPAATARADLAAEIAAAGRRGYDMETLESREEWSWDDGTVLITPWVPVPAEPTSPAGQEADR